ERRRQEDVRRRRRRAAARRACESEAGRVPHVLRGLSRRERPQMAVPPPSRHWRRDDRGNDIRSHPDQREDRSQEIRGAEMKSFAAFVLVLTLASAGRAFAQGANASGTLRVTVVDPSSAVVPGATVTVKGTEDATKAASIEPATSGDGGVAVFSG